VRALLAALGLFLALAAPAQGQGVSVFIGSPVVIKNATTVSPAALAAATSPFPGVTGDDELANLWITEAGGSCVRASNPESYAAAVAANEDCDTVAEAYQAASDSGGDLVLLGCDTTTCDYGTTTDLVRGDTGKTADTDTTFRPSPGTTVLMADLEFQGAATTGAVAPKHITIDGDGGRWQLTNSVNFDDSNIVMRPGSRDITVREIKAAGFLVRCGFELTFEGNEFTDRVASGVPTVSSPWGGTAIPPGETSSCPSEATPSADIIVRDNYFHEIWKPVTCSDGDCHREALHVQGVDGLLVEGNRWEENLGNTATISFNIHGDSTIRDVELVNNSFGMTYAGITENGCTGDNDNDPDEADCPGRAGSSEKATIHFSSDTSGNGCEALIRFNTFVDGGSHVTGECPEGGLGVRVDSNLFDDTPGCSVEAPSYSWTYNRTEGAAFNASCDDGNNASGQTFTFTDRAAWDLHLSSGNNAGNPTSPPATDYDGDARSGTPDAGMDEL
jgi:hypothetical protein